MPKQKHIIIYTRLAILITAICALVYIITTKTQTAGNIFLAMIGFSAVVFIHECGHFFVAKAAGIKVEVFSIFIPPILLGIRRTTQGFKVRILPAMFPKDNDPDGDGMLCFTFGPKGKEGETEYRIGTIPIAGYVKMLGQEDTGADKQSQDPRSFSNKSIPARMAVIAAGVTFNIIAALVIMVIVFSIGINRVAPVIGGVIPESPAQKAHLQTGDRIIEINGNSDHLEYMDIIMAAALSDKGEKIQLKVKRRDNGPLESISLTSKKLRNMPVRLFGLLPPQTLTIAKVTDPEKLLKETSLKPGDKIISTCNTPVKKYWEFENVLNDVYLPSLSMIVERKNNSGQIKQIKTEIPLYLQAMQEVKSEANLKQIYSMVPCLSVITPSEPNNSPFKENDIFLAIADVNFPTYKEMRDLTTAYENKKLPLKLLRTDPNGTTHTVKITVTPKQEPETKRVIMGVAVVYDGKHPRIAKTIDSNDFSALKIPRGALVTAVNDTKVSSFYDIINCIRANSGTEITIHWQQNKTRSGAVAFKADNLKKQLTLKSYLGNSIPLAQLKEMHKADNFGHAVKLSYRKNISFILQTYITLKKLISRNVPLKAMSGPVGIATIAYRAVEESFMDFLYLLAFISANLAVVNFLPIPVVDGGIFILLIIEKIQGKPLSIRIQEIITYAGLTLILSVFVYLTYNDIMRLIKFW